jgi:uncharacterized protein YxeA
MKKPKHIPAVQDMKWVFFILTAIILAVYIYKQDKSDFKNIFLGKENPKQEISEKVFELATEQQIEELDEKIKALQNDLDKKLIELQQTDEELKKRNLLLGTITNENFYILKNRGILKDLLYLNLDWTIDRLPKYIQLPNKEDIEKLLKDNQ